ncbi:MAG: hypothetical protein V8Q54_07555 [Alistipes senegalensis]
MADNPVRRLTQLTVAGAMNRKPWSDADAEKYLAKTYRKAAPHVLQSLKAAAHAQEQFIKLMPAWFWRGDGLSVGGLQPLQFWQMFDNPEAPAGMAFVRQEVVGVPEYCTAWRTGNRSDEELAAKYHAEKRLTPPDVLREMTACADRAVAEAEKARAAGPANAPSYLKDIIASAYLHRTLCQRNAALVEAALFFYRADTSTTANTNTSREQVRAEGPEYGAECIAALNAASAQFLMRALMLDYCPRRRTLRHAAHAAAKKLTGVLKREINTENRSKAEFEALRRTIEGKWAFFTTYPEIIAHKSADPVIYPTEKPETQPDEKTHSDLLPARRHGSGASIRG